MLSYDHCGNNELFVLRRIRVVECHIYFLVIMVWFVEGHLSIITTTRSVLPDVIGIRSTVPSPQVSVQPPDQSSFLRILLQPLDLASRYQWNHSIHLSPLPSPDVIGNTRSISVDITATIQSIPLPFLSISLL